MLDAEDSVEVEDEDETLLDEDELGWAELEEETWLEEATWKSSMLASFLL